MGSSQLRLRFQPWSSQSPESSLKKNAKKEERRSMTFKGSIRKCLSGSGPSRRSPGLEMLSATFSVTYFAAASKTLGDGRPSDGGGGTTHCAVPGKFALLWVAASVSRRRASYRRPPGAAPEDSQVNQTAAAILLKHNVSFLH